MIMMRDCGCVDCVSYNIYIYIYIYIYIHIYIYIYIYIYIRTERGKWLAVVTLDWYPKRYGHNYMSFLPVDLLGYYIALTIFDHLGHKGKWLTLIRNCASLEYIYNFIHTGTFR